MDTFWVNQLEAKVVEILKTVSFLQNNNFVIYVKKSAISSNAVNAEIAIHFALNFDFNKHLLEPIPFKFSPILTLG